VSTFPFLAVLLCAMGSLILLLLVIDRRARVVARIKAMQALEQVAAKESREAEARQAEWERRRLLLHQQLAQEDAEVATAVHTVARKLQAVQSTLGGVDRQREDARQRSRDEEARLVQQENQLKTRRAEVIKATQQTDLSKTELARLTAELEHLEQTLEDLRILRRKQQQMYSLVPYRGKRGDNRRPLYLECTANALIIHPDRYALTGGSFLLGSVLRAEVEKRLNKTNAKPEEAGYVLMLIRPDGITTYYRALSALQGLKIDFGYEFIDQGWILDFSEEGARQPWMVADAPKADGVLTPGKRVFGIPQGSGGTIMQPGARGVHHAGNGAAGQAALSPLDQLGTGDGGTGIGSPWPARSPGGTGGPGLLHGGAGGPPTGAEHPTFTGVSTSLFGTGDASGRGSAFGPGPGGMLGLGGNSDARTVTEARLPGVPNTPLFGVGGGTGQGAVSSGGPMLGSTGNGAGPGGQGIATLGLGPQGLHGTSGPAVASPQLGGNGNGSGPGGQAGAVPGFAPQGLQGASNPGLGDPLHAAPLDSSGIGLARPVAVGAGGAAGTGTGAGGAGTQTAANSTGPAGPMLPGPLLSGNAGPGPASGTPGTGAPGASGQAPPTGDNPQASGTGPGAGTGGSRSDGSTGSASPGASGQAGMAGSRGGGESGGDAAGGSSIPQTPSPLERLLPRDAPVRTNRVGPTRPLVLVGNRDWIIAVDCKPDAVILTLTGQRLATSELTLRDDGGNALRDAVQKLINRRQATVRPGEPPYRPLVYFRVPANSVRTYYLAYPLLEGLGVPMRRESVGND
jgi:hypothetical protein